MNHVEMAVITLVLGIIVSLTVYVIAAFIAEQREEVADRQPWRARDSHVEPRRAPNAHGFDFYFGDDPSLPDDEEAEEERETHELSEDIRRIQASVAQLAAICDAANQALQRPDDPYKLLGVIPGASQEQVKAAYRAQVALWHPDKLQSMAPELQQAATERLTRINAAFAAVCEAQSCSGPAVLDCEPSERTNV